MPYRGLRLFVGWLILHLPLGVSARVWQPVNTSGYLDYTYSLRQIEQRPDETTQFSTLWFDFGSFLWQPWVITYSGGLGLSHGSTTMESVAAVPENTSDNKVMTGNINIQVLPSSWFPLTLFAGMSDSRTSSDRADDRDSDRLFYGFRQVYAPPGGGAYTFNYRRNRSNHPDSGSQQSGAAESGAQSIQDQMGFSYRDKYLDHTFDYGLTYQRDETREFSSVLTDTDLVSTLGHGWGEDGLSVANRLTYIEEKTDIVRGSSLRTRADLSSVLSWRPSSGLPLTVSGFTRLSGANADNRSRNLENRNYITSFGARYRWSDEVSLGATVRASAVDSTGSSTSTSSTLSASYSSRNIEFHKLDYSWSASTDTSYSENNRGSYSRSASFGLGHGVGKTTALFGGSFGLHLGESGAISRSSGEQTFSSVEHSAGLDWSKSSGGGRSLVQLSFNDGRDIQGGDAKRQAINFQLSREQQISRLSSVRANINFNANRSQTTPTQLLVEEVSEETARLLQTSQSDSYRWDSSTSISLNYNRNRVFGVRRLRFISQMSYQSKDLIQLEGSDDEEDNHDSNSWSNTLDYRIGRLYLKLRVDMTERRGENSSFVLFQVRRNFG